MMNVLFVWIPKTAGTSIFTAMKRHGGRKLVWPAQYNRFNNRGWVTFGHISVFRLIQRGIMSRRFFKSAFKFCFVRNPWDRMVSLYGYAKWLGHIGADASFDAFCERIAQGVPNLGMINARRFQQANSQYNWIYHNGKCRMDFVGRYENIKHDIQVVFDRLQIHEHLGILNRSEHRPYQEYYNDTTRELVGKLYQRDIELFGYSFS